MNLGRDLRTVLVMLACFVPVALVMAVVIRDARVRRFRHQVPFKELRRRPAGEAVRLKLASLDETIFERMGLLVGVPVLVATQAYFLNLTWTALVADVVVSAMLTFVIGWRFQKLLRERANYRLGYDGERFVGEELNSLIADGFEIFHDVPFNSYNIDHVLLGPPGVFAVETKTRRKPVQEKIGKEYHVEYEGACLRWPWGTDDKDLQQAANNSESLSRWLTNAVGDPVPVTPILTLPGWWVDRKARPNPVHVLNPKEIRSFCGSRPLSLSSEMIRRVRHQLEEKCKLEFE